MIAADTCPHHAAEHGVFITFEGGDGVGKTTHISLLADELCAQGYEVVRVREPGGTALGEALRAILLDPETKNLSAEAELLLYEAARAQIVAEVVEPALSRNAVVLCDRFTDSTLAYQGYGRKLPLAFIRETNRFAARGIEPTRTMMMLCTNAQAGLDRAEQVGRADRLEQAGLAFHECVDAGFVELARAHHDRMCIIDSSGSIEETQRAIRAQLSDIFPCFLDERE